MFNTVVETQTQAGRGFFVVPNELLVDKPVFVQGEAPQLFDEGLRQRASELNQRFESASGNGEST